MPKTDRRVLALRGVRCAAMGTTHRRLHSKDWSAIEGLIRTWDPGSPDNDYWGAQIWHFTDLARRSEWALPAPTVVSEDGSGTVVAFAAAYRVPCTGVAAGCVLYMTPLVVAVEARHQGVATGLVRYLTARARDEIRDARIAVAPILVWEGGDAYTWERYGCVPADRLGVAPPRPDLPSRFWHGIDLTRSADANRALLDAEPAVEHARLELPALFEVLDQPPSVHRGHASAVSRRSS